MSDEAKLAAPTPEKMLELEETPAQAPEEAAVPFVSDISDKILSLLSPATREALLQRRYDAVFNPIYFEQGVKKGGTVAVTIAAPCKTSPTEEEYKTFAELLEKTHADYPFQGNVMVATQFNMASGQSVILSYPHMRYQDYDAFMTKLFEASQLAAEQKAD